jgi:RNase P subunit RPR2
MSYKRKENLNARPYWERSYAKKQKYKNHEDFHYRGEIKITGKETDMQECKECHEILPIMAFTTHTLRSDGARYLKKMCRQCHTVNEKEARGARKNAPPKPDRCDRCHKKIKKLQVDHIHGSTTFRGWLCTDCNSGMGKLGDNLEGLLQAAIYLENDTDKIIETLHKVFNEMFARTND